MGSEMCIRDRFRAHISWSKKGDSRKILPAEEQLVLQKVGHNDEGTYICTAENGLGLPATAAAVLTVLRKFPVIFTKKIYPHK